MTENENTEDANNLNMPYIKPTNLSLIKKQIQVLIEGKDTKKKKKTQKE